MRKNLWIALALTLALTLVGAAALADTAAESENCVYTVYNATGETVTELRVIDNGTGEMSENYAGEKGLAPEASVEIGGVNREGYELTLVFRTESGYENAFPTLHFETVPISLLKVDAESGATTLNFFVPDATATYTVYNVTGEKITEITLANNKTGEAAENLVPDGLADGASVELTKTVKADATDKEHYELTLAFKTESGYEGAFTTLHYETVPISLLKVDAESGATTLNFFVPDATATYTVYNVTGEKITEITLANNKTGEAAENLVPDGLADGASVELTKTVKADATDKEHYELTLAFKTESGYEGAFTTLHYETVPISLIKVDAESGATTLSFTAPAN